MEKQEDNILVIGDLHGNPHALWETLRRAEQDYKVAKLILVGDILADRNLGGLDILREVHTLRQNFDDITLLAGNHDYWFLNMFFGDENKGPGFAAHAAFQGVGMLELMEHLTEETSKAIQEKAVHSQNEFEQKKDRIVALWENRQRVMQELKDSAPNEVDEIRRFQITHQVGDILITHVDPTIRMLKHLSRHRTTEVNTRFQTLLNTAINNLSLPEDQLKEVDAIARIFLGNDYPRRNFLEQLQDERITTQYSSSDDPDIKRIIDELKILEKTPQEERVHKIVTTLGFRKFIHGHSMKDANPVQTGLNSDVMIYAIDRRFGIRGGTSISPRDQVSAAIITPRHEVITLFTDSNKTLEPLPRT